MGVVGRDEELAGYRQQLFGKTWSMLKLVSLYRVVSEDGEATFEVKRFEGVEVAVGDSRKLFVRLLRLTTTTKLRGTQS